jgi:hypothetical protein
MPYPLPIPVNAEEIAPIYDRVGRDLAEIRGNWGDNLAAVSIAVDSYRNGKAKLTSLQDVIPLVLGFRLITSYDYCKGHLATGLVRELVEEMESDTQAGQWHAETHLFSLAQLLAASSGKELENRILPVPKSRRHQSPDIDVSGIGIEISVRDPSSPVADLEAALLRIKAGIEHAQEKVSSSFPRVAALVDFGPRDILHSSEIKMLVQGQHQEASARIERFFQTSTDVPALLLTSCIMLSAGDTYSPRFQKHLYWNSAARPIPAKHRKVVDAFLSPSQSKDERL